MPLPPGTWAPRNVPWTATRTHSGCAARSRGHATREAPSPRASPAGLTRGRNRGTGPTLHLTVAITAEFQESQAGTQKLGCAPEGPSPVSHTRVHGTHGSPPPVHDMLPGRVVGPPAAAEIMEATAPPTRAPVFCPKDSCKHARPQDPGTADDGKLPPGLCFPSVLWVKQRVFLSYFLRIFYFQ